MAKKYKVAGLRKARQKRYRAVGRPRRTAKAPAAPDTAAVPARSDVVRLTLGPGGRFVVPKKLREALGAKVGDTLTAEVVDGELRVFTWETAVRKAQEIFKPYRRPGVSIVEELIEARRREFELEERKFAEDRRRSVIRKRHG